MRYCLFLALFAATACGKGAAPKSDDDTVECALAGSERFERVCRLERMSGAEGLVLTLRAPDGAFRRLLVTRDGRGVVAADGAETAGVTVVGTDRIEVELGGDRYRLPARVK